MCVGIQISIRSCRIYMSVQLRVCCASETYSRTRQIHGMYVQIVAWRFESTVRVKHTVEQDKYTVCMCRLSHGDSSPLCEWSIQTWKEFISKTQKVSETSGKNNAHCWGKKKDALLSGKKKRTLPWKQRIMFAVKSSCGHGNKMKTRSKKENKLRSKPTYAAQKQTQIKANLRSTKIDSDQSQLAQHKNRLRSKPTYAAQKLTQIKANLRSTKQTQIKANLRSTKTNSDQSQLAQYKNRLRSKPTYAAQKQTQIKANIRSTKTDSDQSQLAQHKNRLRSKPTCAAQKQTQIKANLRFQ